MKMRTIRVEIPCLNNGYNNSLFINSKLFDVNQVLIGADRQIDTLNYDLPQTINLSLPSVAAFSTAVGEGRGPVVIQSEAPWIRTSVLSSDFILW